MKKILTLSFFIGLMMQVFAQTDGITYQAVIIGPDALELPGIDSEGNYLPNATIAMRFTIYDSGNQIEFQEVQITDTDEFGRINLLIGDGDHDYFKEISWDGTPKDLKVEIDFNAGNNFETMSRERLTFLPFAYHRNITATGTLTVDDKTFLNGELQVEGPTSLNSTLDVNNGNATNLTGTLTVDGETNLNAGFNVNNASLSNLTGDLNVGANSMLNGTLDVVGLATFNDLQVNGDASFGDLAAESLVVNESTTLQGTTLIDGLGSQIRLTSYFPNAGATIQNHPVLIDGGRNGLAIRVSGSRNNNTNFISFYDSTRTESWGRIEGETPDEFDNNADYLFDQSSLNFDVYDSEIDLGFAIANNIIAGAQLIKASTDFRACVGLGGCLASPGPADIAFATIELISAAAQVIFAGNVLNRSLDNRNIYNQNKFQLQGVTYASGAGDYAEYLQRMNTNEKMRYGDIVGVRGGKISKNLLGAERMMVVSYKPIVLGNMPQKGQEEHFEKVAFMGQVPVKVFGKVAIGDYIIPSGMNDGAGIAVSPENISLKDIGNIVGTAWSEATGTTDLNMVNVAVGLNRNDNNYILERLDTTIKEQALQINELKNQIAEIHEMITDPNKKADPSISGQELTVDNYFDRNYELVHAPHGEVVYWEITSEDLERGLQMAKEQMELNGVAIENHPIWKKIYSDPKFKEELLKSIKSNLDKQLHYHKDVNRKAQH